MKNIKTSFTQVMFRPLWSPKYSQGPCSSLNGHSVNQYVLLKSNVLNYFAMALDEVIAQVMQTRSLAGHCRVLKKHSLVSNLKYFFLRCYHQIFAQNYTFACYPSKSVCIRSVHVAICKSNLVFGPFSHILCNTSVSN